jgi:hypothetical protein
MTKDEYQTIKMATDEGKTGKDFMNLEDARKHLHAYINKLGKIYNIK